MKAFQFFDGKVLEQLPYMPYGHGKVTTVSQADLDKAVEAKTLIKADTLDELLSALPIDKDAAKKSIDRYNELAKKGTDDDFGKTGKRMFAIETAPFYCVPWGKGDSLVGMTGLESDADCHVYTTDFKIIPNLYVAGNTQGNRFTLDYPETMLGLSHAMAVVFGRIAANNALKGI
jgi:hypothetical protein